MHRIKLGLAETVQGEPSVETTLHTNPIVTVKYISENKMKVESFYLTKTHFPVEADLIDGYLTISSDVH